MSTTAQREQSTAAEVATDEPQRGRNSLDKQQQRYTYNTNRTLRLNNAKLSDLYNKLKPRNQSYKPLSSKYSMDMLDHNPHQTVLFNEANEHLLRKIVKMFQMYSNVDSIRVEEQSLKMLKRCVVELGWIYSYHQDHKAANDLLNWFDSLQIDSDDEIINLKGHVLENKYYGTSRRKDSCDSLSDIAEEDAPKRYESHTQDLLFRSIAREEIDLIILNSLKRN